MWNKDCCRQPLRKLVISWKKERSDRRVGGRTGQSSTALYSCPVPHLFFPCLEHGRELKVQQPSTEASTIMRTNVHIVKMIRLRGRGSWSLKASLRSYTTSELAAYLWTSSYRNTNSRLVCSVTWIILNWYGNVRNNSMCDEKLELTTSSSTLLCSNVCPE